MPVYSMTGYASAQNTAAGPTPDPESRPAPALRVGLELRSVNSRFLDVGMRLPDELRALEPALRELLVTHIRRGKVELRAAVESDRGGAVSAPALPLLQRLAGLQEQVRVWMPQAAPLSVAEVLQLAGAQPAPALDWGALVLPLAKQAVTELAQARQREGERLCAMMLGHIGQLRALAAQAAPLVPQLVEQLRQRFLDRWREAMALTNDAVLPEAAQDRALTEATAFAIRIDVAEELTRLASHLDEMERLLKKGGEIGKRLEFLIQELHREANTLGSKSSALELTRLSVDMKVLIEQLREQVQNIE